MKLKLIKASEDYREQICSMLDEWYSTGEKIIPYAIRRLDYHDFKYYCDNLEVSIPPEGYVTDSTFFCLDEDRNLVVGAVNIRHYLNESLLLSGGHIGDGVRPSERRKGIATQMIGLALEECRKLGILKVLMICDKDNLGSARSIVNNGGILENEILIHGAMHQRYWIDLTTGYHKHNIPNTIRHMSIEEIPECVNVIRNAFHTVADEFGFTKENAPRFTAFSTDENRIRYHFCVENRPMYVYIYQGNIVGYYSLAILQNGEIELNNLSVIPDYRHKGIGHKLLEDCFKKVSHLGGKKLKIGIVEENALLRKWYENHGFIHVNTQKFDFFPFTCGYMEKCIK